MLHNFVNSCAKYIDTFFEGMLQYVDRIGGIVGGLCGLAAFLYIGTKVWSNYSRGESIEIYPLLRPFVIGLLCANFNVVVVGGIRGLADPVCEYFQGLETESNEWSSNAAFEKKVAQCKQKVSELQAKKDNTSLENVSIWDSIGTWFKSIWQKFWDWVFILLAQVIGFAADLFAALTKFVLIFTRCFSLSVLCLLGPIVFAISIFPGYKQGLSQWIARFVCLYMWMPLFCLCDIFIHTVTSGIGDILINNIDAMIDTALAPTDGETVTNEVLEEASYKLNGISANMAIIGALISLLTASLYKSVPTLASWIIAGGEASGQLSSVAGFAVNTAMFAGMAASVVGGGALNLAGKGARSLGGAVGKGLAKAGGKIAGNAAGGGGGGNGGLPVNGLGAGPMDAPLKSPVGFHTAGVTGTPDPITANLRLRDGGRSQATEAASSELPTSKFRKVSGKTLEWVGRQLRRPKLNHIMKYGDARQRYLAAQDPYITRGVLKKAIDDPNVFVQTASLKNDRISQKLLKRAAKYGYAETATQAARLLQERQGGKTIPNVQQVFNANIPVGNQAVETAAPFQVEAGAAQPIGFGNRATPTSDTAEMPVSKLRHVSGKTLEWVGKQLRRPKLNHIMKYGNARDRYLAAQDPYITRGVLKKAIDDPDLFVQQAALKNGRISQKLLKRAAKYGYADTAALAVKLLQQQTKKGGKNANQ